MKRIPHNKKTKEDFIKQANEIHNDKYDYSKVDYIANKIKVKIICPIHGEFEQRPNDHLRTKGCNKCGISNTKIKTTDTIEQFIEKAKKVHGDLYDYSKVKYINNRTKVEIICDKHGSFFQKPNSHIDSGYKCTNCCKTTKQTKQQVLDIFKNIHGDEYDYSKFEYVNNLTKSTIICKKHGEFLQRPKQHRRGEGCPVCGIEKSARNGKGFFSEKRAEKNKEEWIEIKAILYFIKFTFEDEEFYKIGITTLTTEERFSHLKDKITILNEYHSNLYDVVIKEQKILRDNKHDQYFPINKLNGGETECFKTPKIISL